MDTKLIGQKSDENQGICMVSKYVPKVSTY